MKINWTQDDMIEFEAKYPEAYNFLLNRSLLNEYKHLEANMIILNNWQKSRLQDLEKLFDGR